MIDKMKIFIGSSSSDPAKEVMDNIASILENIVNVNGINKVIPVKWNDPGAFIMGKSTIENLIMQTKNVDAAIFIYAEDDKLFYEDAIKGTPRDNVLFEHGLFAGSLGIKKSIIVKYEKPKIPTDLGGIVYLDYDIFKQNTLKGELTSWIKEILDASTDDEKYHLKKHGIEKIYTFSSNDDRNKDKKDFLENEERDIFLVAHTGNSFLHTSKGGHQGRFFSEFRLRLITKPYKAKVILLNPYSLEARKIFYAENYHDDISTNIINLADFEKGKNYQRFEACLEGIKEIKQDLGSNKDKLEIKISNGALDCSILMSKSKLFYEPYICSRYSTRAGEGLNVFEVTVNNLFPKKNCSLVLSDGGLCDSCNDRPICIRNLHKAIAEQFHILWETSISLSEYEKQIPKYRDDFTKQHPGLFPKHLVQHQDSWLAFDPVIGCTGNCAYCFLGPQGWNNTCPKLQTSSQEEERDKNKFIEKAYTRLNEYKFSIKNNSSLESLAVIPISIGNKTDMIHPDNLNYLNKILDLHEKNEKRQPIVLITKQLISETFIENLCKYSFDIYIFYSISFLPEVFEPNVPDYKQRIASAKAVKRKIMGKNITNIHLIHYWRPIIGFMETSIDDIFGQIKGIFDCSICIGMKITPEIEETIKSSKNEKLYNYIVSKKDKDNSIIIFEPSFPELQSKAVEHGYPIFKHTSCALSFIQKRADYNGTMWRTDICKDCMKEQKEICKTFKDNWRIENYQSILDESHIKYELHDDCIEITNSTSQEWINYLTHRIGKPLFSEKVRNSLVWPSSNQIYFLNKYK